MSSFDRPSHSFYDVKLVSREKGGRGEREEGSWFVRSLRADEIKRDDLAIHASSASHDDDDDEVALTPVGFLGRTTYNLFSVKLKSAL